MAILINTIWRELLIYNILLSPFMLTIKQTKCVPLPQCLAYGVRQNNAHAEVPFQLIIFPSILLDWHQFQITASVQVLWQGWCCAESLSLSFPQCLYPQLNIYLGHSEKWKSLLWQHLEYCHISCFISIQVQWPKRETAGSSCPK